MLTLWHSSSGLSKKNPAQNKWERSIKKFKFPLEHNASAVCKILKNKSCHYFSCPFYWRIYCLFGASMWLVTVFLRLGQGSLCILQLLYMPWWLICCGAVVYICPFCGPLSVCVRVAACYVYLLKWVYVHRAMVQDIYQSIHIWKDQVYMKDDLL